MTGHYQFIISSVKSLSFIQALKFHFWRSFVPHVTSAAHVMSDLPLIVLSVSKAEYCAMSHYHHEIPSPTVDGKSLLSSLSLSSTDLALVFVRLCPTLHPHPGLL